METRWNWALVVISILIAILHSCVGFDLASRMVLARGRARGALVLIGGMALGIGIWSMHFLGMAALEMPGVHVYYSRPLLILSFAVACGNSGLSLYLFTRRALTIPTQVAGARGPMNGAEMSQIIELVSEWKHAISPGEPGLYLVDVRDGAGMSSDARKIVTQASKTMGDSYCAVFGATFTIRAAVNLAFKAISLASPTIGLRFTQKESEGRAWLVECRNRHVARKH